MYGKPVIISVVIFLAAAITVFSQETSNVPMTRADEALAVHDQEYGHSVTFVELKDGRILLSTGSLFSISADGGIKWGEPYEGRDRKCNPIQGECPSLVNLSGGTIGLAVKSGSNMVFRRSEDDGKTWSEPLVMNSDYPRAEALQDVMIRTQSGRIIIPVYFSVGQGTDHHEDAPFPGGYVKGEFVSTDAGFFTPRFSAIYLLYSDDEGKTWQKNKDAEMFILTDGYGGPQHYATEPSIAEISPGKLMMIARSGLGRLYQSWSDDNGETWTRLAPTQLASSTAPGQLRKLPGTDHLLVVWTQQSEREIRQGFIQTRLSSAISRNNGGVWEHFQNVESIHEELHVEPGPIRLVRPEAVYSMSRRGAPEFDPEYAVPLPLGYGRWSYPSVLVTEDRVLISHSYSYFDNKGKCIKQGGSRLKVFPVAWFYGGEKDSR